MAIDFNNNFSNSGYLTTYNLFKQDNLNSKDEVSNAILNGLGGNKEAGFDFKSIVDLSVAQKMGNKIEQFQSDITNTNIRIDALSQLRSTYREFQSEVLNPISLDSSLNGTYANTTNDNAVDVTAGSSAQAGASFSMSVNNLAQSESLTSAYYTSPDHVLGEGVMSIDLGTYDAGGFTSNGSGGGLTMKIEEGMTLKDLANEINMNSRDVTARIIEDETGARLALFSNQTGKDNALNISINATADPMNDGLNALAYDRATPGMMTLENEAIDASYTVNGVDFTSSDNHVEDIFGVDVTLKDATASSFNVSTASNNQGVVGNVEAFVYSYNMVMDELNRFTSERLGEDGEGSLYRETVAKDLEREILSLQRTFSSNGTGLGNIGISFNNDGSMKLDQAALAETLANDPSAVTNVFSDTLTSSNPDIQVLEYGNDPNDILTGYTENGTYSIEVTQAAQQATMTGTAIGPVTIGAGGHEMVMQVNGKQVTIGFDEGEYTSKEVASRIAEGISAQTYSNYTVKDNAGAIEITSAEMGASQSLEIISGGAVFGLSGTAQGTDIQGRINGVMASGSGTTLTSFLTNDAKGLSVNVSSNQVGVLGDVTVERGAMSYFSSNIDRITGDDGIISNAIEEYKAMVDDKNPRSLVVGLEDAQSREQMLREKYNTRFSASQQAIATMQNNLNMIKTLFGEDDK